MVAIPSKSNEITKVTVEPHPDPTKSYVYLTIETDNGSTVRLCMEGIEAVDDMINKLVSVRNRSWPFPAYQVPAH